MWWRWWCTQCSKRPRVAVLDTRWSGQISGVCLALFMLTIYAAMVVQVEGAGEGCISSAAPINGSLNGFFDLSSRRAFRWSLTTSREAAELIGSPIVLETHGTGLRQSDYVTLVSTPMHANSQHTACSASFSYKLVGGRLSVEQLVAGEFMEIWCENIEHGGWRTMNVRLHYTKKLRVFFKVTPLQSSNTVKASLGSISVQCCKEVSGCIYYPSPDFHCGMAGFQALSKQSSFPEVTWERRKGQMQFSSDPGLHASIVSPTYWWHSERPAQCLVQFQSQTIKVGHDNTPYVNILPPLGRLDLSVYGFDDILWKSSFSKLAFRSRHKQHFFSMATSGPFQLLLNASSVHRGIAITVEGISVHCCPAIGNSIGMTPPAATDTSDNGSIPPTDDATRPHGDNGDGAITSGAGGTFTSGNDETSLRERDAEPTGGSIKQVKAVLIPMGAVAVILLIIIGVLCCIKQVPSTPSSNSSGSAEGIRRPFQSSMNNPGYEETIPVLQRVSRQNSDALALGDGRNASNDVVHLHPYENSSLQGRPIQEQKVAGAAKRIVYENTSIQSHKKAGNENSSQHSGETLPLGKGANGNTTPKSGRSEHFYHRLDVATADEIYSRPYIQPPCTADDLYSHLAERDYLSIERATVRLLQEIGSGHFAHVHRGEWTVESETKSETKPVAVKRLRSGASVETTTRFLREAAIMAQFNHQHIVHLYGVVVQGEPMMLVLELMTSNVLEHLHLMRARKYDTKLQAHLLSICRQIASGMEYLAGRSFVHRDLAARNVMIDPSGACKIGDFGMARDISADHVYVSGNERVFPIKWTSPEAIEFIQFTTASDCWSYGVTLYEVWSLGERPYGEWTNEEVFKQVKGGYRLQSPRKCPHTIYYLMLQCWQAEQKNRPSFADITQCLSDSDDSLLAF